MWSWNTLYVYVSAALNCVALKHTLYERNCVVLARVALEHALSVRKCSAELCGLKHTLMYMGVVMVPLSGL